MNALLSELSREHTCEIISPQKRQWAENAIRGVARSLGGRIPPPKRKRRCLIVHLDGVPKILLQEGIARGELPFLSRLVKSGAYGFDSAFWGSPASTPYFQASLLYGIEHPNLPAYHWYDRKLGREVRMNIPTDTLAIEQRLESQAHSSLLEGGGTSYMSLFRAGASNLLCMSALENKKKILRALPKSFRGISATSRGGVGEFLARTAGDFWDSMVDVGRWVNRIDDWRFEREFLFNHFFLSSFGWNFCCSRCVVDMVSGAPVIYLVYGSYDEVSHRRGPFSSQAKGDLAKVDSVLEELYAVAKTLEHPYDLYLLTDHGHVDSLPFEQRRGKSLREYLFWGPAPTLHPDVERGLLDGRPMPRGIDPPSADEPVVVEAGNFAHVYVERRREPLDAMDLLGRHRGVLARAISQPDIGIVVVRRGTEAVAIVQHGVYSAREIDSAPLPAAFSGGAVKNLLLELPFMPNAGDVVLYGQAVSQVGTVGFAWEFGSHGGLTKTETDSAMLWPLDGPLNLAGLNHSRKLHDQLSEAYRH